MKIALKQAAGALGWAAIALTCPPAGAQENLALGFRISTDPLALADVAVVDADTIDVGRERFRLSNLDAPESFRPDCDAERALGERANAAAREIFRHAATVTAYPTGRRDYRGRVLARIEVDGRDFAQILIDQGLGRPWRGRSSNWCTPPG